jgi:REP element-mobilizing transposase RayT
LEGAIYYVTSKGLQGQPIFKDKQDYKMYIDLLTKYKSQHKFRLYSYCLLPDRLQLLIETGDDATISEIMHDLNSLYTKYFNGRYSQKGHLFESRFRSVLVEKAQYLLEMTRHIHRSPETLPLSMQGLESAKSFAQHPYSSYDIYVHRTQLDGTTALDLGEEVGEVMSFLKEKDDPAAYERFCLNAPEAETEALAKKTAPRRHPGLGRIR